MDFPSPTALQEKDDKTIRNGNAELDALCHVQDYHHRGHRQAKGNRYGRNEHESGVSFPYVVKYQLDEYCHKTALFDRKYGHTYHLLPLV